MTTQHCWDFFDTIFCITLDCRPDRRREAQRQFSLVGLADRVEFHVARKDTQNPERGIYQSHLHCLRKGLANDGRHVLIFEDDILFRNFTGQDVADAALFLREHSAWDALFLGCITNGSTLIKGRSLARIQYRCLAHAYALNRPFAARIVATEWAGIPFDEMLRRSGTDFFALAPMCAFQRRTTSDNRTAILDRIRNLLGGLACIQKGNELYQNNKVLVLGLHLLIAVALIFICLN